MNKLILAVLLVGAGWWFFIGGRTITQAQVEDYYLQQQNALLSREPEALCELLASDFESENESRMAGHKVTETANRDQACANYHEMYKSFDEIGNRLGGIAQLDYHYEIDSIEIAPNKKSATVEFSYTLDVAGSIMNIRSTSTETLIRRNGKMLIQRSVGETRM